ncbi:hypothetical protein [Prosthecomicrobium sp. N25]|uniref:hypothetical protein n=1 Tax=Prosthecomicrobium sp. N25 TaxID=3129254 RepID=UPI003077E8EB
MTLDLLRLGRRLLDRLRPTSPLSLVPKPLVCAHHPLVIVWSARSACTSTTAWFATASGFEPDLPTSGLSVHEYRRKVIYGSPSYRAALRRPLDGLTVVHVARDPGDRAVSTFRHALRTGFEDRRLAASPLGPFDREAGFSFARWLDYLEAIDIRAGNVHYRPQWHPFEETRRPDIVIHVGRQDLFAELDRVGRRLGLPGSMDRAPPWLARLEAHRAARQGDIEGGDLSGHPFGRLAAAGREPWPRPAQLLTPDTRRRLEALYAVDVENLMSRV